MLLVFPIIFRAIAMHGSSAYSSLFFFFRNVLILVMTLVENKIKNKKFVPEKILTI
jgi:hypothetical protein